MDNLTDPGLLLAAIYVVTVVYLLVKRNTIWLSALAVASALSLIWQLIAYSYYSYNIAMMSFWGLSLFPLFAWALGLFASYVIFQQLLRLLPIATWWRQLAVYSLFFIVLLLSVETIAYYALGIHNLATSTYPGLAICNCLHAPPWMQAAYLSMGPIFFCSLSAVRLLRDAGLPTVIRDIINP